MIARRLLLLLALHIGLAACGGTETGNPGGAQVALGVRASDPAVVRVGGDGPGDRVDALLLAIDEAALIGCGATPSATPVFAGGALVDLVSGAQSGGVPAGEYCGIRIILAPRDLPPVADAPGVAGATVAAHGVRSDGVPFTVVSRAPLTIVADGEPFQVRDADTLLFAFDASRWLRGILAEAAVVEGRAVVDGTGATAAQFERQVAADLFRDVNGNGAVDAGETRPLAATALSARAR